MLFKTFDVNVNWVQIDDDVIPRPSYIGAGQWMEFWDDAASENNYQMGFDDAAENYREELSDLEAENGRLEDENRKLEEENKDLQSDLEALEKEVSILENRIYELEMGDDL